MTRATATQIEQQATMWVARMDGDQWNPRIEAELEAWIEADPRHEGALLAAQAAWAMLDGPYGPRAEAVEEKVSVRSHHSPRRIGRRWVLGGFGAAVAASLGAGFLLSSPSSHYATEVGEIRRVPLADGSTAAINTASEIRVALGSAERRVTIAQGEAWFQVAKDRARPFVVEAGPIRVRAVGTAFSVRRRDDGAEVLVTEGVVEAWNEGATPRVIRIAAGNSVFIADNAVIKRLPSEPSSVDRALAWRSGKIDLVGQPLNAAVAEFNRYNRRQIVIADPALRDEAFDGVFRTDDPVGFATMVRTSLSVPVDLSDPTQIRIGAPES